MKRSRTIVAALLSLAATAFPSPGRAQEEEASSNEIREALKSQDSHLRHSVWQRLNAENSTHYKVLVQILQKFPWHDRDAAIVAIAKAFSDDTLKKIEKDLQKNKSPMVRQGMAAALAKMNDEKFYPLLYGALDDDDPFVRRVVVHSLRVHKKPDAVDALVDRFQKEDDPVVRTFLEDSLNEITQAYQGTDPVAWNLWWTQAKADKDYELGKTDDEAIRAAEEFGRKLKERKTQSVSGGVTLETSERGSDEGIPILVLPAYGYSKFTMLPFLSELERSHKLYYIDLPTIDSFQGLTRAGQSNVPYYPIDKLVEAFESLREATKQERFAIMSCGMNSWIAMRYAQKYPGSVAANIFVAPISSVLEYGKATDRMKRQKAKDLEMFWFGLTRTFNTQTGESTLDEYNKENPPPDGQPGSIDRRSWSMFFANESDSTISLLYGKKDHRMGSVAIPDFHLLKEPPPSRPIPTLVICGKASVYTSEGDCQAIAKYYKGLCQVFPSSSCMPFAEESQRFNELVSKFLARFAKPDAPKKS